jgi:heterodisulfide reductase subunit A2
MSQKKNTAVCFSNFPKGNGHFFYIQELTGYLKKFPNVVSIWNSDDFEETDIAKTAELIKEKQIERIVITGEMPGIIKSYFIKAMNLAGRNSNNIILAGFKENGISSNSETERIKSILACAIYNIPLSEAVQAESVTVNPATLVIGGGIAGIQASLEIANSNNRVYLVEKSSTIGGHMAMFDKTFPTLDCAACILTPKMVEVGQHPNINLMTYCEVKGISGRPGDYAVKILKKAKRVDQNICIGCGNCAAKCPSVVKSEFDAGTMTRKAIYIAFPQAVPNKYIIDADNCRYVQDNGKCGVCVKACPVNFCINLDEKDEEIEITVGNIIVAIGFNPFDAKRIEQFGYGKYPNVLTSLEFERLTNASGPTGGNIRFRTKNKKGFDVFTNEGDTPESLAVIHCIGSRDVNYNKHCSRVCCMYSLKLAHLAEEKMHGAKIYEYFIDMRAYGKGYEEFYARIKKEGVHMVRGRTAKIEEKNGKLLLRTEDILNGKLIEQQVDMVVLSVGLEPKPDAKELAKILGIETDAGGWFIETNYNIDPVGTSVGGIFVAGVCQGPKDIPDTVAQASAAASRVIQSIINGKTQKSLKDIPLEIIEKNIKTYSALVI